MSIWVDYNQVQILEKSHKNSKKARWRMKNLVSKGREIANGSREEFEAIYVEDARNIKKKVNDSPPFTANSTRQNYI